MKERGIIFNAEMVRAVLEGRKTQTRRVIDWRRTTRATEIAQREDGSNWPWSEDCENGGDYWHSCPFGEVGDRLWIRETFCPVNDDGEKWIDYRATPRYQQSHPAGWECDPSDPDALKWHPSTNMPRWASRITLEVTGVRVERLHAITLGDICKEFGCGLYDFRPATYGFQAWEHLWKSIYGAESWQANPWVWVIEFQRVEGN